MISKTILDQPKCKNREIRRLDSLGEKYAFSPNVGSAMLRCAREQLETAPRVSIAVCTAIKGLPVATRRTAVAQTLTKSRKKVKKDSKTGKQ